MFLDPRKTYLKNALQAEKLIKTNVCCESNITNVLGPLTVYRVFLFLFLH